MKTFKRTFNVKISLELILFFNEHSINWKKIYDNDDIIWNTSLIDSWFILSDCITLFYGKLFCFCSDYHYFITQNTEPSFRRFCLEFWISSAWAVWFWLSNDFSESQLSYWNHRVIIPTSFYIYLKIIIFIMEVLFWKHSKYKHFIKIYFNSQFLKYKDWHKHNRNYLNFLLLFSIFFSLWILVTQNYESNNDTNYNLVGFSMYQILCY